MVKDNKHLGEPGLQEMQDMDVQGTAVPEELRRTDRYMTEEVAGVY